jgi:hypothetical protein
MAEETGLIEERKETDLSKRRDAELSERREAELTTTEDADQQRDEPEQIRRQIEKTRGEMGETIDALQEKLSVENISEQVTEKVTEKAGELYETAKDTVYDATVKKAGTIMNNISREIKDSNIINQAADNAFPIFLISLGAGLLLFRGKNKGNGRSPQHRRLSGISERDTGNDGSLMETGREKITGAAGTAYETVSDTAGSAYDAVSNTAGSAYRGVSRAAGGAYEKVSDLGHQAQNQYEYHMRENPLAVGVCAFAVGAAVGLSIPSTEYENELAGHMREDLVAKIKGSVNETIGTDL